MNYKSIQEQYIGNGKSGKQDNYKLIFSFNLTDAYIKSNGSMSAFAVSVESDTVIAGGNAFSSLESLVSGSSAGGLLSKFSKLASTALSSSGTSTLPQVFTRMNWSGSQKPQFVFNVTFYSENSNTSILDNVMKIKRAVYPSGSTLIKKLGFFSSPLGYKVISSKNDKSGIKHSVTGTLDVKVGKWLHLKNMLVLSESITFSKEVNRNGEPLFARGTITLETHEALTFKQFESMFPTVSKAK